MDIDLAALRALVREKDISLPVLVAAIEQALLVAYHRTEGANKQARVELDTKTGHVVVWAHETDEQGVPGPEFDDTPEGFGRIAATTARQVIVQRLEEGSLDDNAGLEAIADQFQLSSRQIRRIVQKELGVPPIQLLLTRRLLLAKQLLTETSLPIAAVAFASGFASLRRFNDAFARRYGMPPTRLRRSATQDGSSFAEGQTSSLQLVYRPPYDWRGILTFLQARALAGIEDVTDTSYARTVQLGNAKGWIRLTQSAKNHALLLELTHTLMPVLPALLARVRALFDLDARPDLIAKHLGRDPRLSQAVKGNPGLRVPGAFNGFELGMRAILGQQVTVRAATTVAGRFVATFGEPIVTPFPALHRLTPTPARVAAATIDEIARHGIVTARAKSIVALAAVFFF